ncbi:MAG: type IV pilus twitching motility protein PilT [Armatimonadota bacterium]|nr:type IV pilus twitching motility protein PilT [Armatimonadota bacterium]MDR7548461.1 type IV pilus twitching motility protein PilT [Armatimonadota bacterium]
MTDITDLLVLTKERGASDLHLATGAPPTLRANGRLVRLDGAQALTREEMHRLLYDILTDEQKALFEATHDLDFSLELAGVGRFRVNAFLQRLGEGMVLRLIPEQIRTLDDLGMPPVLKDLAMKDRGLVLVTGPTGSGKTTTLAAMVDHMNEQRHDHIITIEDPIEFVHRPKHCNINQREVGPHTRSFAAALRSALREDPDVILVGEMRDLETIAQALTAAETGHLVLSTLHTNNAPQTISRIVDVFPPHQQEQIRVQLADALLGVVAQTLVPTADATGRVAALEIMVATPAVRNMIRENKVHQLPSAIQTGARDGMQSLDQHLKTLVKLRRISPEDAVKRAVEREAFLHERAGPRAPAEVSGFVSRR